MSNDGLQVTSRLLMTKWGKVEHAAITLPGGLTRNGENEISWSLKMEIKNELFGENRLATVDGFQGRECDIVIFSVTRTTGSYRFLADDRRLNVAISRARNQLYKHRCRTD